MHVPPSLPKAKLANIPNIFKEYYSQEFKAKLTFAARFVQYSGNTCQTKFGEPWGTRKGCLEHGSVLKRTIEILYHFQRNTLSFLSFFRGVIVFHFYFYATVLDLSSFLFFVLPSECC